MAGVRKGKRSLLACHTRFNCPMENICKSLRVKLGIKDIRLVKSLIGWEVTLTGPVSECNLLFARERLHIAG